MAQNQKKHDPSFYRGLIREQKSNKGRHPTQLLKEARKIKDPYYASLALFRLSDDPRLPISEGKFVAREALRLADEETRPWRRAELFGKLAKYAKTWNIEFSEEDSHYFLDEILSKLQVFPKGKGLSQNLNEISKHIGCSRLPLLLQIAVENNEFVLDDSKTIIRQWATTCSKKIAPEQLYTILFNINDSFLQSKLMGYLYLQCVKKEIEYRKAFDAAISKGQQAKTEEKTEALRYLSRHIRLHDDFLKLKKVIISLNNPIHRVQLLTTLAGNADKKGFNIFSINTFTEALDESKNIHNEKDQVKEQIKIATGFLKIGKKQLAKDILIKTHKLTSDESIKRSIEKTMKKYDLSLEYIQPIKTTSSTIEKNVSHLPNSFGHTLGLYDTYEGSIKPIHIRTLARAAPLCAAYGLDLALIGFPIHSLNDFITKAKKDTTIGKSGSYLQYLHKQHRIHHYPCSKQKMPKLPEDKIAVATTAHPDEDKSINITDIFKSFNKDSENKIIVIMGLGRKGLPPSILEQIEYHMELTGLHVPLETCTAMGMIAMKMNEIIQKQRKK